MNRAYSVINWKALDEDKRIIVGIATTPETDRVGDIIEPRGAEFKLPLPFLMHHDSWQPIGHVTKAKVTDEGIEVTAELARIDEPGTLRDRLDEAWQSIKSGLIRGLSIGFQPLEAARIEGTFGYRFIKWALYEVSAVTIPANAGATIQSVKSIDKKLRAAPGREQLPVVRLGPAPGDHQRQNPKGEVKMKISEKIARFEEKRAANMGRIAAIHEETDESLNETQLEEIRGLEAEIATIDRDLPSLKRVEAAMASKAQPVRAVDAPSPVGLAPTPGVTVKAPTKPEPGIRFARFARCVGLAHKLKADSVRIATELYGDRDPVVVEMIKAAGTAVSAMSTGNAAELIGNEGGFADFVEYLRHRTIVGRFGTNGIPSLRQIPFRVPLISQSTAGTAYWVGEGDGKPLTRATFGRTELAPLKVAVISVATMEVLRDSSPSAERLIRDDLTNAIVERIDLTFIDPTISSSAGVSPASIAFGAESIVSTGDDAEDIRLDVRALMQKFIDARNPLTSGVWIMSASNALALSMLKNTLGQPEFPAITITGGTFEGLPVIVSDHIGDYIVLVNASDIWLGDEGGIAIDVSQEASLQMVAGDDEGATNHSVTPVATSLVSMFQTNSVAFRAERTINWARRRSSAVAYLSSVSWGGPVPPS